MKTIGVISYTEEYGTNPALVEAARHLGLRVCFLSLNEVLSQTSFTWLNERFVKILDGLVINARFLYNRGISIPDFMQRIRQIQPHLPIVSLGRIIPETLSILQDNRQGMAKLLEHLFAHGYRRFVFLAGPIENASLQERYLEWRQFLKQHPEVDFRENRGLPNIVAGASLLEEILASGFIPDAVCASEDSQAQGASAALLRYKLRGVALAGFNNCETALSAGTQLTTVSYAHWISATTAARTLAAVFNQQPVPTLQTLASPLVVRQSCGCLRTPPPLRALEPIEVERLVDSIFLPQDPRVSTIGALAQALWQQSTTALETLKRLTYEAVYSQVNFFAADQANLYAWDYFIAILAEKMGHTPYAAAMLRILDQARILESHVESRSRLTVHWEFDELQDRLMTVATVDEILEPLGTFLGYFGLFQWHFWVRQPNGQLKPVGGSGSWASPEEFLLTRPRGTGVWMDLQSQEENYGVLTYDVHPAVRRVEWEIFSTLSNAVRNARLNEERNRAEQKMRQTMTILEVYNVKLQMDSESDVLTGLENRRGFIKSAGKLWNELVKADQAFSIVFADMDGLKAINDTFGHEAGDLAIQGIANILRQVFRESDKIARYGGDEFTILVPGLEQDRTEIIRARLRQHCELWNTQNSHPWKLSISVGFCPWDPESHTSFDEHLQAADKLLYAQKQLRTSLVPGAVP